MSSNDELKWLTERKSWRYIPFRYQASVAVIVAALLYVNAFTAFFSPFDSGTGACGSLFRPVVTRSLSDAEIARRAARDSILGTDSSDDDGETVVGLPWDSISGVFSLDEKFQCPRGVQSRWWELFASFGGIAICGMVLRRAIRREAAEDLPS
jgi:hypothetical protein